MTPEIAEALGLDKARGALVANVWKDGPAERAGVKVGDVIVEFDGKEIKESHDLPIIVARTAVDKKVRLKVLREKKDVTLSVTVGERKEEEVVASTGSAVHIYDLTNTEVPTLDKPRARFETEDVIISIQWAPDESSLAVITHLGVKILHLATGEWRTLAALSNSPRGTEIDVVAFINTLSWTE